MQIWLHWDKGPPAVDAAIPMTRALGILDQERLRALLIAQAAISLP